MKFLFLLFYSGTLSIAFAQSEFNTQLADSLKKVLDTDQKYRLQIDSVQYNFGKNSEELNALWKTIKENDSLNQLVVLAILDEHGWLGEEIVGDEGNSALFLVIQHSKLAVQEKYLPMMREAVANQNAEASSLALLEDRVALRRGGRQIYGSQIGYDKVKERYYVMPLDDPDHVNERRTSVGLPPLQEYISMWGLKWNSRKYKKQLPYLETLE